MENALSRIGKRAIIGKSNFEVKSKEEEGAKIKQGQNECQSSWSQNAFFITKKKRRKNK